MKDFDAEIIVTPPKHFFDSGAFSLLKKKKVNYPKYMRDYARFVKKYAHAIDYYANVDVIGDPQATLINQQYLEGLDLSPVPVVHFKTSMDWLNLYIDKRYTYIALGGLVAAKADKASLKRWLDKAFDIAHPEKIRLHGFGITSFPLMKRYPWYSVDSTSWVRIASIGSILVPGKDWDYSNPIVVRMTKKGKNHYPSLSPTLKARVDEWVKSIGLCIGKRNRKGRVIEHGVSNHCVDRIYVNLELFERFSDMLPKWKDAVWRNPKKGLF